MKAIVFRRYGTSDELELKEVPKPAPKDDEVLIRVHASSINSWDWEYLNGKPFVNRLMFGLLKPKREKQILGADVTGVDASHKLGIVRSVGADHVIDYAKEDFTTTGERYDLIIDCQNFRSMFDNRRALRPGGTYAMVGGSIPRVYQLWFLNFIASFTRMDRKLCLVAEGPNKGLTIVCTPAQHYSNRGIFDYKETLWSSWSVIGPKHRVFYSGDTGFAKREEDAGLGADAQGAAAVN